MCAMARKYEEEEEKNACIYTNEEINEGYCSKLRHLRPSNEKKKRKISEFEHSYWYSSALTISHVAYTLIHCGTFHINIALQRKRCQNIFICLGCMQEKK